MINMKLLILGEVSEIVQWKQLRPDIDRYVVRIPLSESIFSDMSFVIYGIIQNTLCWNSLCVVIWSRFNRPMPKLDLTPLYTVYLPLYRSHS